MVILKKPCKRKRKATNNIATTMNAIEVHGHTSCTSFSNHSPNEEAYDEKTVFLTPKQHLNLTADTIISHAEPQLQQSVITKNTDVDVKQQSSPKLKLGNTTDNDTCSNQNSYNCFSCKNDHNPIKPVRTITPKRNTKSTDDGNNETYQIMNQSSSTRSNESTVVTASTALSSLSASTNASSSVIARKEVRFVVDRKGHARCEYFRNMNPKSKQESLDCFYQMSDFQQFRRECKQEALLQQKTSTYRDNFAAVYAACTTGNFKNVTRERAYISAATCRGLEVVVYPTLHRDRKNTIATILKNQRSLPATMTEYSQRAETIAAASRYLSKQARQLARVFGSGDAAVVIANQRIESIQQQTTQEQQQQELQQSKKPCSESSEDATLQIKQLRRKSNSNVVVPHCFVTC